MKRIVKFIIRPVVWVGGAFVVWWGLSCYGYWIDVTIGSSYQALTNGGMLEKWLEAPLIFGVILGLVVPAVCIVVAGLVCAGIVQWWKWSWKKAGE